MRSSLGPRPPLHSPEPEARAKAIPWVVLGIGLLAILFLGALLAPRRSTEAASTAPSVAAPTVTPAAAPPPDPNDLRLGDLSRVDPTDVLERAKARALGWNRDALLVSMRAQPVLGGRVNLASGGTIEYVFGKPTGEGFGAGARVSGKRFRILLTGTGSTLDEVPGAVGRAALEPNCPLDEAARKAQAAGLPASAPVSVVYEINDKHPKPVWRVASATGTGRPETRLVDGWTCAILVR